MSLTCMCSEREGDSWFYIPANDFSTLKTKRRQRCCSCKKLIPLNDECLEFYRYHGEIKIASWFMCYDCGAQFMNLEALEYCIDISDNMLYLLEEHRKNKAEDIKKIKEKKDKIR